MDKVEARVAELYERVRGIARQHFNWLTETQLSRVARDISLSAPFATFRNEGWSRPQDAEFVWQLEAIERTQPELIERAPSAADLTAMLLAQAGAPSDPVGRLTVAREVAALNDDERLEKARSVEPTTASAPSAQTPPHQANMSASPREKPACEMTQTELDALIEQRMGRGLLTSQVRTYSQALIEASHPMSSPAIEECKAKLASGRTWSDISPTTRMGAEREAKGLGKTLRELGLGP